MKKSQTQQKIKQRVEQLFDNDALPSLIEYISIPNVSRAYDQQWNNNGLLMKAAKHIKQWTNKLQIKGLKSQIIQQQGLSPIIFTEVQGNFNQTILFYGHYDKQPPFEGWQEGLGPYTPVIKDDKLYGRGGADDGYSTYGALIAIKIVQQLGIEIPKCVIITEGDEQSGSLHMNTYLSKLKQKIGNPSLIFCLDSGVVDYDRLWLTNSMRGLISLRLKVEVLKEGVHSGEASGIVPSPFRILRELLQRLQSSKNGDIHESFHVDIPSNRYQEMYQLSKIKKQQIIKQYPFIQGVRSVSENSLTSIINRGWKPQLAIVGVSGLPEIKTAGSVMLPFTELKLSMRLPPTKDVKQAEKQIIKILTQYPPYNSKITISDIVTGSGFNAPSNSLLVEGLLQQASKLYYGNEKMSICSGMSIPLLNNMKNLFPKSQFIVTGVLGPESNAHGPNQFLHLKYVKKLIMCMSHIVAGYKKDKTN